MRGEMERWKSLQLRKLHNGGKGAKGSHWLILIDYAFHGTANCFYAATWQTFSLQKVVTSTRTEIKGYYSSPLWCWTRIELQHLMDYQHYETLQQQEKPGKSVHGRTYKRDLEGACIMNRLIIKCGSWKRRLPSSLSACSRWQNSRNSKVFITRN